MRCLYVSTSLPLCLPAYPPLSLASHGGSGADIRAVHLDGRRQAPSLFQIDYGPLAHEASVARLGASARPYKRSPQWVGSEGFGEEDLAGSAPIGPNCEVLSPTARVVNGETDTVSTPGVPAAGGSGHGIQGRLHTYIPT